MKIRKRRKTTRWSSLGNGCVRFALLFGATLVFRGLFHPRSAASNSSIMLENTNSEIACQQYQDNNLWKTCRNEPSLIVYNRIGKAGSTTLVSWLRSNVAVEFANSPLVDASTEKLTLQEEQRLVRDLTIVSTDDKLVYARHVHYLNFTRHGHAQPASVTLMRDPALRYISQFYYWRHGTVSSGFKKRLKLLNTTILDCMSVHGQEWEGCPHQNYMTNYLCGHGPNCQTPPDEATYQQARKNMIEHYALVLILEEWELSTNLLRVMFAYHFRATDKRTPEMIQKQSHKMTTKYPPPTSAEIEAARRYNHYDQRLYNLGKALLQKRKDICSCCLPSSKQLIEHR